jgi:hypothetical protein
MPYNPINLRLSGIPTKQGIANTGTRLMRGH